MCSICAVENLPITFVGGSLSRRFMRVCAQSSELLSIPVAFHRSGLFFLSLYSSVRTPSEASAAAHRSAFFMAVRNASHLYNSVISLEREECEHLLLVLGYGNDSPTGPKAVSVSNTVSKGAKLTLRLRIRDDDNCRVLGKWSCV